jgi:hypothetical protein
MKNGVLLSGTGEKNTNGESKAKLEVGFSLSEKAKTVASTTVATSSLKSWIELAVGGEYKNTTTKTTNKVSFFTKIGFIK